MNAGAGRPALRNHLEDLAISRLGTAHAERPGVDSEAPSFPGACVVERLLGCGRERTQLVDFGLPVRLAIGVEDVVMPHSGTVAGVRLLPGSPREGRLRFPVHESPIDHA